jgi:hypothetical protein
MTPAFLFRTASWASLALAAAAAADAQPMPFDGAWRAKVVCEDHQPPGGAIARGYTVELDATVTDGSLLGERGKPGDYGSIKLSGRIAADGAADLLAEGTTGNPNLTVGRVSAGQPYRYRLRGTFEPRQGSATRTEVRPCTATFTRP